MGQVIVRARSLVCQKLIAMEMAFVLLSAVHLLDVSALILTFLVISLEWIVQFAWMDGMDSLMHWIRVLVWCHVMPV